MQMFDCVLNHFPPRDAMSEKWHTFLWNLKVFVKYCAAMWIFLSQRWSLLFLAVFLARCCDSHTIPNSALGAAISCCSKQTITGENKYHEQKLHAAPSLDHA
jgi:hypothetical protein